LIETLQASGLLRFITMPIGQASRLPEVLPTQFMSIKRQLCVMLQQQAAGGQV
jgi:hypothetical protein